MAMRAAVAMRRWSWLLILLVMGLGCDALIQSDRSSDDSSDSSKKKRKKKKKKKGSKKKKQSNGDDDDDDDDDDKPPAPTPAPPAAPLSACEQVIKTLECIRDKMPADSRAQMDDTIEQVKAASKQSPQVCTSMQEGLSSSAKSMGCDNGASPDTPSPVPGPGPSPTPPSSPNPTSQSPAPSSTEWAAVTKEVLVTGSSKLNCESKMLREWLRVSCRGRNHTGGTPKSVRVTKGGGKWSDAVFAGTALASLTVRFVEGVDVDAEFVWTDRTHTLRVSWPSQSPEPPFKGKFDPRP